MNIDDIAKSIDKKIPYQFLNEIAEDTVYNLLQDENVLSNIKKILDIQQLLQRSLNIYNQAISIQNATISYSDKTNNMNIIVYEKPEIIKEHKTDLINETCNNLRGIDFNV